MTDTTTKFATTATNEDPVPDPEVLRALGRTPEARRRRWVMRGVWIVAGVAAAVGAFLLWKRLTREIPIDYVREPAARGDLTITVTATGSLEPVNRVDVGSEISGRLITVLVTYNERVKRGQVLAEIDTQQLDAQVLRGEATLEAARAALAEAEAAIHEAESSATQAAAALEEAVASIAEAEATWSEAKDRKERTERLAKTGAAPQQDVESARGGFNRAEAARTRAAAAKAGAIAFAARAGATKARAVASRASAVAQVAVAQAALDADRTTLAKAKIRSPIDGIVLSRLVEPGQTVAATFQTPVLFTLAEDLARMEMLADVDEADIGQVAVGQDAYFTVDTYPGRRFPARITELRNAARTVQGVVTYPAVLSVDNAELLLRPGMTATAEIVVAGRKDVLLVPNGSLRFTPPPSALGAAAPPPPDPSRRAPPPVPHVWVLRDGAPLEVQVRPGATDGLRTEILDGGLRDGEAVLVDVVTPDEAAK